MVRRLLYLPLVLLLLSSSVALAQQSSSSRCEAQRLSLSPSSASAPSDTTAPSVSGVAVTNPRPAASVSPTTDAEAFVQRRIRQDGLHVVHFWAPWCPNSERELADGWSSLVADNPNVTFTFVTVWNDGEKGADVLDQYNVPDRVAEVAQPDLGPSDNEANRRQSFLSHPVTWIPSTWIFHNNGALAFALNYGEMKMSTIQSLLDATRKDW